MGFSRAIVAGAVLALSSLAGCAGQSGAPGQAAPAPSLPSAPIGRHGDFTITGEARQGALLHGVAPAGVTRLTLDGSAVPVGADGAFLIAFDRDAGPAAKLIAQWADGSTLERDFAVQPGAWRIEQVDASPTADIPSAEFLARRKGELERIAAARDLDVQSDGWRQTFRWPIAGRVSGVFGSQRVYRGTPGSYHGGVDIAAGTGTPFYAPADGVVVLAADQPFTLEGHLLMIAHGMGLGSAFLHCSSLAVKEGDVVHQGQLLGTVGATGRATGPHLHWGMKWLGARIDPARVAGPMP